RASRPRLLPILSRPKRGHSLPDHEMNHLFNRLAHLHPRSTQDLRIIKKPGQPGFFFMTTRTSGLADLEAALHHGEVAGEGAEEGEVFTGQTVGFEGHAGALAAANHLGV